MSHEAVGHRLDKMVSLTLPYAIHDLTHAFAYRQDIHPIHLCRLDPMRTSFVSQIRIQGHGALHRRTHSVAIVLADKDDRQFPECSKIECFVGLSARDG